MSNYNSEDIKTGYTDIQKVRKVPQMYGPLGDRGVIHATKEIVQNSIDEGTKVKGLNVLVNYDPIENRISIEDNGRGIPHDKIYNVFSELHVSGKGAFNDNHDAYGVTAGVHGVGVKYTNAVSKELTVNVYRDGKEYMQQFIEGEPVADVKVLGKSKKIGTKVEFVPDEKILGRFGNVEKNMLSMLEDMSYLSMNDTNLFVNVIDSETKQVKQEYTFTNKDGLNSLLKKYMKSLGVKRHLEIRTFETDKRKDGMIYKVAYTYSKDVYGTNIQSFCNFCTTVAGGYHVDGFVNNLSRLIKSYMDKNMSDKDKKSINVTLPDTREGLIAVVVAMHPKPILENQTKDKVGQTEFLDITKELVTNEFDKMSCNKDDKRYLNDILVFVKNTVVVRNKTKAMKQSYLKEENDDNTFLGSNGKLEPARGGSNVAKELFLVEGDSAKGSAVTGRDDEVQAIFPFRGKSKNVLECTVQQMLNNEEFKTLLRVLGTNVGDKFDLEKLRYDKIIIMTDADIDGQHITSLLCVFFMTFTPELVKAGKLYKVIPPLYRFKKGNKYIYVNTYRDFVNYIENLISKEYKVKDSDGKDIKPVDLKELLVRNKEYVNTIESVARRLCLAPEVVEDAIAVESMPFEEASSYITNKYRFLDVKKQTIDDKEYTYIEGTHDRKYHYIIFDEDFEYKYAEALDVVGMNNYKLNYKLDDTSISLYGMLKIFEGFKPKDIYRYKGLIISIPSPYSFFPLPWGYQVA